MVHADLTKGTNLLMLTLLFLQTNIVDGNMVDDEPNMLIPTTDAHTIIVLSSPTITFAPTITPSLVHSKMTTIQPSALIMTASPIADVIITTGSPNFPPTMPPSLIGEMSEAPEELIDVSGMVAAALQDDVRLTLSDMSDVNADDIVDSFIKSVSNGGESMYNNAEVVGRMKLRRSLQVEQEIAKTAVLLNAGVALPTHTVPINSRQEKQSFETQLEDLVLE